MDYLWIPTEMFTLNDKQTYYIIPTNMYATAINEK